MPHLSHTHGAKRASWMEEIMANTPHIPFGILLLVVFYFCFFLYIYFLSFITNSLCVSPGSVPLSLSVCWHCFSAFVFLETFKYNSIKNNSNNKREWMREENANNNHRKQISQIGVKSLQCLIKIYAHHSKDAASRTCVSFVYPYPSFRALHGKQNESRAAAATAEKTK